MREYSNDSRRLQRTQETARRDRRIRDTQMCGIAACAEGAEFTAW